MLLTGRVLVVVVRAVSNAVRQRGGSTQRGTTTRVSATGPFHADRTEIAQLTEAIKAGGRPGKPSDGAAKAATPSRKCFEDLDFAGVSRSHLRPLARCRSWADP